MIQDASVAGNAGGLVFFLFDLLHLDGEIVSAQPLTARRLAVKSEFAAALQRSPDRPRPGFPRQGLPDVAGGHRLEARRCSLRPRQSRPVA
jgi:hypothetical protein